MHVLTMTAIGLVLVAIGYVVARTLGREGQSRTVARACGAVAFVWLLVSAADFYLGVFVAGYAVAVEAAAHLVIFAVPALAALGLAVYASRHDPARPL